MKSCVQINAPTDSDTPADLICKLVMDRANISLEPLSSDFPRLYRSHCSRISFPDESKPNLNEMRILQISFLLIANNKLSPSVRDKLSRNSTFFPRCSAGVPRPAVIGRLYVLFKDQLLIQRRLFQLEIGPCAFNRFQPTDGGKLKAHPGIVYLKAL